MSQGTTYVDSIMDYSPDTEKLLGGHNFYPRRYTGLEFNHYLKCTEKFKGYNLNTMAFVNSQAATFG
ncbi:MupG family TIM beta-alpha barrel fold protein, partial [Salmonella enterica]|uniref:MupG family TIM beta-alpha barrel fold protein n=1 Tax=Salmonella enterica TaxID=28901 RepID=UPI003CEC186F